MKLKYDNLEDAKTKLNSTYCLYKGKAVYVKVVHQPEPAGKPKLFHAMGGFVSNGRGFDIDIDDPDFNCSEYNIGYMNAMHAAVWWYRVPLKQWKQGLRHDQLKQKYSSRAFAGLEFGHDKRVANMLENDYPSFANSEELLRAGEANIVAFSKNFAMTYDRIHDDLILEYKGTNIGHTNKYKEFKLLDEHKHLAESLKEAVE